MAKPIEIWICYSSISYHLFFAWQSETHNKQNNFISFAPGSPLHTCELPAQFKRETSAIIRKYRSRTFVLLAVRSLLSGRRLTIRVPHLNLPILNKTIKRLHASRIVSLELYDDGFLGVLSNPSVCRYLRPIFRSVCCWDISGWYLSQYVKSRIKSPDLNHIKVQRLPCRYAIDGTSSYILDSERADIFIVESKYMDYTMLSKLVVSKHLDLSSDRLPFYYQHPWSIKRNALWPGDYPRIVLTNIPVERHLASHVTRKSHLISGMTSTLIFHCELVKQAILPRHSITLLLKESLADDQYSNETEIHSFISYMRSNFVNSVDLTIYLNEVEI